MPGIRRLLTLAAVSAGLVAAPAAANAATVANGDFETGNLSGWQVERSTPPGGNWFAYSGTISPESGDPVPAPPQGSFAAIADQGGPGRNVLYQDVALEPGATQTRLSLFVYYVSTATIAAPNSLDPVAVTNQQYRIDVMKPGAPITSVDPGDILLTVFRTTTGGPLTMAPTQMQADLNPFAGQTVRLRFAEVDNGGPLNAATDAVSITSNALALGKPKLNQKKGTASQPVTVPGPGVVTLAGKGVVTQSSAGATASRVVTAAGTVNLKVKAKGKKKATLNSTGKAKVKATITYTPTGGNANSQVKKIKLKQR